MTINFEAFPKIPRLNRTMVLTEKLDGTNAAVIITEDGEVGAQSRNRLIGVGNDNFGFAHWVQSNADILREELGPGRHFGEWWGKGIQHGYGLDHKRFSLFNTHRWGYLASESPIETLGVVPLLAKSLFDHEVIDRVVERLRNAGSVAAFDQPAEGVVVYLPAANQMFKVMCVNDDIPKSLVKEKC